MPDDSAHLRRVRKPIPFLAQLASGAVDKLTGTRPTPAEIAAAAADAGVPIAYVLDELERRVRQQGRRV